MPLQPQYVRRSLVHGPLGLHVHVSSQPSLPVQISPLAQSALVEHVFVAGEGADASGASAAVAEAAAVEVGATGAETGGAVTVTVGCSTAEGGG